MDEDGELCKADIDLANLPFYITFHPSEEDFWTLPRRKELIISFLYYFDYCEKNNIKLLPENLAWKEPLLKFLDQHNNE